MTIELKVIKKIHGKIQVTIRFDTWPILSVAAIV